MIELESYDRVKDERGNTIFVLHLFSDKLEKYSDVRKIADEQKKKFDTSNIYFTYSTDDRYLNCVTDSEKRNMLWNAIIDYFEEAGPGISGILCFPETKHKITPDVIEISVKDELVYLLTAGKLREKLESFLKCLFKNDTESFGNNPKVKISIISSGKKEEEKHEIYDISDATVVKLDFSEDEYEKAMAESVKKAAQNKKMKNTNGATNNFNGKYYEPGARHKDNYKGAGDGKKRRRLTPEEGQELPKDSAGNEILIGGEILANPTPLKDVNNDIGFIAVRGKIFSVEEKKIPSGSLIRTIYVTDNTYSLACKFFYDPEDAAFIDKYFSTNKYVTLYGDVEYDKYSRETTLKVRNAVSYTPPKRLDEAEKKRVELHLHTNMSQQDAITRPKDLMKRLKDWGHTAVAITDHGGVQGFPDVFNAAGGDKNQSIKIIYGMECYLTDQQGEVTKEEAKKIPSWHCILLVKNLTGLRNLYELISKSNLNYFYKKPRIPRFELEAHREGIIVGSACSEGELYNAVVQKADDETLLKMASFYDYLEIQPTGNDNYLIRKGIVSSQRDLERISLKILEIGDRLGLPTCATCDVHFLDPEDAVYRAVLQGGQGYQDFDSQPPLYLRTTEEMLMEFAFLEDRAYEVVVENTNKIADQIEVIRPVPAGTFFPVIDGAEEEFRAISYEKAKATYGDPVPQHIMDRLNQELDPIIDNGYAVMYMAAQKLVAHSASNGYTVGSRGSVGSSLAAFMAGITEVNALPPHYRCENCFYQEFFFNQEYEAGCDMPKKDCPNCGKPLIRDGFDIPFQTFLGFNADKTPDIDLNFATKDQPRAHKYCGVMFGDDHVFRAGTIAGLAEKTARGYVLKYLEKKGMQATEAEIKRLAAGFEGVKRTTGQHPGGIIVVPKDHNILDFTAVQHPADDPDSEIITTHFDYHFLHETILKLDILGHDGPEIIKCLEDFTGISMKDVDISDPGMLSLFTSSEALNLDTSILPIEIEIGTLGIPEFGTHFAMGMLKATHPTTVSELVRISGLSHGTDVWQGNASDLIAAGTATLKECICCRDDIMLYLIKMGLEKKMAFDIMESVRKGKVAKGKEDKWPLWKQAMIEHNVPDWYIGSCEKIQYMFPRAHAVAYVMLSTRMAWFKLYQPLAYYATRFTLKVDDFDGVNMLHGIEKARAAMLEIETLPKRSAKEEDQLTIYEQLMEMYARHIEFLPIDLYKSDATRFVPEGDKIRPPFAALAGVGINAAEALFVAKNDGRGEYESIADVAERAKANRTVIEALRTDGVFGDLPEDDSLTLFDV